MTVLKLKNAPVNGNFNNLVDDFFASFPSIMNNGWERSLNKSAAPANVTEKDGLYEIELLVPGYKKEDFSIQVEQNMLTLSAEQKTENEQKEGKQLRTEWSYQSFKRSFTLDDTIDADKIEARYENGVLTLALPKKPEVKPATKQISVQ